MVSGTTAGMPTETVGVLAAAATPLLGAIGLFIWNKTWTGDAFALNLVKCWVGTIGFVVAGIASRRGDWLKSAGPEVTAWLVLSAFIGITLGDNLWLYSLRVIGARRVILIDILKPFIALGLAKAALGEGVSVAVALGMCVTLAGVLTVSLEENKNHGAHANAEDVPPSGEGGTSGTNAGDADTRRTTVRDEEKTSLRARGDVYVPNDKTDEDVLEEGDENRSSDSATTVAGSKMITGYFAAAANVALDTWGTVLTKQHGGALNTWEINFVRFGSAAATLALVAAAKVFLSRRNSRRASDSSPVAFAEATKSARRRRRTARQGRVRLEKDADMDAVPRFVQTGVGSDPARRRVHDVSRARLGELRAVPRFVARGFLDAHVRRTRYTRCLSGRS
jgi:drug/metabolite transporter (DMT)-like permease